MGVTANTLFTPISAPMVSNQKKNVLHGLDKMVTAKSGSHILDLLRPALARVPLVMRSSQLRPALALIWVSAALCKLRPMLRVASNPDLLQALQLALPSPKQTISSFPVVPTSHRSPLNSTEPALSYAKLH